MSVIQFAKQVRTEAGRVTWPTRNETVMTTAIVLLLVFILMLFFWLVDLSLSTAIQWILTFGV